MFPAEQSSGIGQSHAVAVRVRDSVLEPLFTAEDVAEILQVPVKSVYELPIRKVRLGANRVRWTPNDVAAFIERRLEDGGFDA